MSSATETTLDFSSNSYTASTAIAFSSCSKFEVPTRHSDMSFDDGNIALLAGHVYFLVHRGLLCRHSNILHNMILEEKGSDHETLEGRPILRLPHDPMDLSFFLRALYGLPVTTTETTTFLAMSALLKLSTAYETETLRREILDRVMVSWPSNLSQWDVRENIKSNVEGTYAHKSIFPHPILVIELGREINVSELLPSAFYDLSRYPPSSAIKGCSSGRTSKRHLLVRDDLARLFRGKEMAARFLSTFVVNELEGRMPSKNCIFRDESQPSKKRACQAAFEAITLWVLRETNGMVLGHAMDPLGVIAESLLVQTREDTVGLESTASVRACEACRSEYGAAVTAARAEIWQRLPEWFNVQVTNWG
ncbi:hypothetical protein C8Q75DRAFT_713174 [Abortiporus biennis]|nr:hypothetical protein C8Q75DRAFT_713174 [Abortiporus biennis]